MDSLVSTLAIGFDSLTLIVECPPQPVAAADYEGMTERARGSEGTSSSSETLAPSSLPGLRTFPGSRLVLKAFNANVTAQTVHSSVTVSDSASVSTTSRNHSSVVDSGASVPQRGKPFRSFLYGAACGVFGLLAILLVWKFRKPLQTLLKQCFRHSS